MFVRFIDDFLDSEDLVKFNNYVYDSKLCQDIKQDPSFTNEFWAKYASKIKQLLGPTGPGGPLGPTILPHVTVTQSRNPVFKHIDKKMASETHKILIYLNDLKDAGTLFYDKGQKLHIVNKKNRLVLFDINLEHESENFVGLKKAIGFRVTFL